jgi:hypothetical protein
MDIWSCQEPKGNAFDKPKAMSLVTKDTEKRNVFH